MSTFDIYKKRLKSSNRHIKEQRRQAADLNNELAWNLADGHHDAKLLTTKESHLYNINKILLKYANLLSSIV